MVSSSYFKGGSYVKQDSWKEAWRASARLDYEPVVDIRAVKGDVAATLRETFKYAVKPEDMVADPDFFLELTRQQHHQRSFAAGGVLKDALREGEETDEELLQLDGSEVSEEAGRLHFRYRKPVKRYSRERRSKELV
jgi:hypothetical protein